MRITTGRKKIRVGDLLVEAGAITQDQLDQALAKQKEDGGRLGTVLETMGFISKELLITVRQHRWALNIWMFVLLGLMNRLNLVPDNLVSKYKAMPIGYKEDNPNILQVAMADPTDLIAIDDIAIASGLQVEPFLSFEDDLGAVIGKYYGSAQAMEAAELYKQEQAGQFQDEEEAESQAEIDNSPIVLLVNRDY